MQSAGTTSAHPAAPKPVAPAWHTLLLIAVLVAQAIRGALPSPAPAAPSSQPAAIPFYLSGTVILWLAFAYVWWGLRLRKQSLRSLLGERWTSGRQAVAGVAIGLVSWAFWYGVLTAVDAGLHALGLRSARTGFVFPQGRTQILVWIFSAITAGFVEETIFRGYFLKQFSAWTRSPVAGLILQAALFGTSHTYFGMRQVILIMVSATLLGALALWRKSLLPAMVLHAWADFFGAVIVRGLPFK